MISTQFHVVHWIIALALILATAGCGSLNSGRSQRQIQPMNRKDPMMSTNYLKRR
jgi:hypothetical protein